MREVDANPAARAAVPRGGPARPRQARRRSWALSLGYLGLGLLLWLAHHTIAINCEPSVPLGLWRLHPVPTQVERGMVVYFPPPPATVPWHPWWVPFLKPVVGIAGDVVCVEADGLWVRGVWYGPLVATAGGMPVPHLEEGCFVVEAGTVFVASRGARSLDSRYFSSVSISDLRSIATPVWVWK